MTANGSDASIEIIGYVTDPKLVGYQILTNYESTYWRALVGNEAWSLYEVLRSFCHEGNNICKPSVKLLTAILGLQDKRALTGRSKIVKGKKYHYPGLIEILQEQELLIAEVKGVGHAISYAYHVNLTPSLLSEAQLTKLPQLLQKKHQELIKRCEASIQELQTKKKPAKFPQRHVGSTPEATAERGGGNFPPPSGPFPPPGGKFPPEQHPINNTQKTTTEEQSVIDTHTQNPSDTVASVVVALIDLGISKRVAERLASRYTAERIFEKIEILAFLEETGATLKNSRGWLRSAIEKDYQPPSNFVSKAVREAKALEEQRREQERKAQQQQALEQQRKLEEEVRRRQEAELASLRERYGTTEREHQLWPQILRSIQLQTTEATYQTLFPLTQLLAVSETEAIIGVPNKAVGERIEHRLKRVVQSALNEHLNMKVDLTFVFMDQVDSRTDSRIDVH